MLYDCEFKAIIGGKCTYIKRQGDLLEALVFMSLVEEHYPVYEPDADIECLLISVQKVQTPEMQGVNYVTVD